MPNWCECDLTVRGPAGDLARFKADGVDFNAVLPYPAEYAEADQRCGAWREAHPDRPWSEGPEDGFNHGGYEWCVEHWGTKWPAEDVVEAHEDGKLVYHFQTAWSPPEPVVTAWAERYPALTFRLRYFEGGMGFQGRVVARKGKVVESLNGKYSGKRGG